jgi:hypothetical protein
MKEHNLSGDQGDRKQRLLLPEEGRFCNFGIISYRISKLGKLIDIS